jgi:hypothetical protein
MRLAVVPAALHLSAADAAAHVPRSAYPRGVLW